MTITLTWTKEFCEFIIEKTVPVVICFVMIYVLSYLPEMLNTSSTVQNKRKQWQSVIHLLVCFLCIGMSSVPFINLSPGLRMSVDGGHWTMLPVHMFFKPWKNYIQPFHFSNGYGLFRRMTGVGTSRIVTRTSCQISIQKEGWGGLEPSIVERPEVILRGEFSPKSTFRELTFRWKPGDVRKRPKQVAPHQPRVS
jgi:Protein of unknown function (DUF1222).